LAKEKPARNASQSDAGGEEGKLVGEINHYYSKIGVGIVELKDSLKPGDKIKIVGHSTDIEQDVESLQVDHAEVTEAKKGDVIGLKVTDKVREGDKVYKI
jgi:translation elongation factor EF-1alpha